MELVLRSWTEDDAPALSRAIAASVEHLRPWMAWAADEPHDDLWRRQLIRGWRQEAAAGGDETFGMWLGDQVVGACGLHRRIGPGGLEIGYWVHAAFTRQGLATEAAR
ncbi:MAG: ribosomal-protein-serine acetyltransferase, partial [Baekduia sp.]|nr:ribosomal-protein-serine acetyltransferase [Baekduia sp.]